MAEGGIAAAVWKFFCLMAVTIAGILMRHAYAADTSGKMEWKKFLLACLTAPALGIISGGVAAGVGATGAMLWAITATVGFLGPLFIHGAALAYSGKLLKKTGP